MTKVAQLVKLRKAEAVVRHEPEMRADEAPEWWHRLEIIEDEHNSQTLRFIFPTDKARAEETMATGQLSLDRYDLMRAGLQAAQPAPSSLVPINEAPLLPPAPVKPAANSTPAPIGAPRQ